MTLQQLHYVITITETGSFNKASEVYILHSHHYRCCTEARKGIRHRDVQPYNERSFVYK